MGVDRRCGWWWVDVCGGGWMCVLVVDGRCGWWWVDVCVVLWAVQLQPRCPFHLKFNKACLPFLFCSLSWTYVITAGSEGV